MISQNYSDLEGRQGKGDTKALYRWNLNVQAEQVSVCVCVGGACCMNSLHDSSLCLDLQTGKPCNGLGMQSALEHPRSPGGGQAESEAVGLEWREEDAWEHGWEAVLRSHIPQILPRSARLDLFPMATGEHRGAL